VEEAEAAPPGFTMTPDRISAAGAAEQPNELGLLAAAAAGAGVAVAEEVSSQPALVQPFGKVESVEGGFQGGSEDPGAEATSTAAISTVPATLAVLDGGVVSRNTTRTATADQWHQRLGHISHKNLEKLVHLGAVTEDSLLLPTGRNFTGKEAHPCTICPAAHLVQSPFKALTGRGGRRPLDKLACDYLPMVTAGLEGEKYLLVFTDSATRMAWGYAVQLRDSYFDCLSELVPRLERESGCRLKTLKSDNGRELISDQVVSD
jgi:hypothetical protein